MKKYLLAAALVFFSGIAISEPKYNGDTYSTGEHKSTEVYGTNSHEGNAPTYQNGAIDNSRNSGKSGQYPTAAPQQPTCNCPPPKPGALNWCSC